MYTFIAFYKTILTFTNCNNRIINFFDYYKNKFNELNGNIRETWKIINNILRGNRRKSVKTIRKLVCNNVTYDSETDIANIFNNYFSTIGKNIAESVENSNKNVLDYFSNVNFTVILNFQKLRQMTSLLRYYHKKKKKTVLIRLR